MDNQDHLDLQDNLDHLEDKDLGVATLPERSSWCLETKVLPGIRVCRENQGSQGSEGNQALRE